MARKRELTKRLSAIAMAALVAGSSILSGMGSITAMASESTTAVLLKGGGSLDTGFRHSLLEAVKKADPSITTDDAAAKAIKYFKPYMGTGNESSAPSDLATNWTKVSSDESAGKAYVLYQNETIWYWSDSPTTYLSKNSAGMFYQLPNLKEADFSGLNAGQAYNMQLMFSGDESLETVTGLDYSNTINVQGLFQDCESLTSLDLSSFQADVLDANGMEMMLDGSGVTSITLDQDFDFVSKTGITGNWTKKGDDSVVWGADELEALYDGDSTSEGIPNAGTYVKTDKAATKTDKIKEAASKYYEAKNVVDDASVFNIWNIESPDDKFTAFCIDNKWTDKVTGTLSVGHGAPYGYYSKVAATIQNLKNGTKAREKDVTGSGLNSNVMSNQGYLNSDNYGYEPLGSNMVEALTALVYFGPKVYGGSDGIINTKAEYNKLQNAIWHFTNSYSDTWDDEALWSNYHYSDIPEEYRNSTKLYIYVSEATAQNLVAIETTAQSYRIAFLKTDANDELLSGAQLQVTGTDIFGDSYSKTLKETSKKIQQLVLKPGTYTVSETQVPDGYKKADDITFTISRTGEVTSDGKTFSKTSAGTIQFDAAINVIDLYDSEFEISKQDVTSGQEIAGAQLEITGTRDQVKKTDYTEEAEKDVKITPITWTSVAGESHKVKLQPGSYILTEILAPSGYSTATSISFQVVLEDGKLVLKQDNKTVDKIVMKDELIPEKTTDVKISKKDIAGNELAGATLQIFDSNGVKVEEFVSKNEPTTFTLKAGTYSLRETITPDNTLYKISSDVTFKVDADGKVTLVGSNGTVSGTTVTMTDDFITHKIKISKVNIAGKEIDGATLCITGNAKSGVEIEKLTWVSSKDSAHYVELPEGTYTLAETIAPDGYKTSSSISFTVTDDGKVSVNGNVSDSVTMTDEYNYNKVYVSKVNVAGKEIEGAAITVTGKTSDGVEITPITWTSKKNENHYFELAAGNYTMTEVTAPTGYKKAESISFTVDKNGKVTVNGKDQNGKLTMTDQYDTHDIVLSKVDVAGNELTGAKITIKGTTIDGEAFEYSYVSDGKKHTTAIPQGSYTMTETTAPDGFEKAESIAFTVDANGKVTINGSQAASVVMTDKTKSRTVTFKKVDSNGKLLKGAQIKITGKDITGKEITAITFTSTASEAYNATLAPGSYTMEETKAPDGYDKANNISFTVEKDLTIKIGDKKVDEIVMTDVSSTKSATVNISKVDADNKALSGAKLVVYYTGSDNTQKTAASWTTDGNKKSLTLEGGITYTLHEAEAPSGYITAADIKFVIAKDGTVTVNGNKTTDITMTDNYTNVVIKKVGSDGKNLSGAKLQLKDSSGNVVDSWTTDGNDHTLKAKLNAGATYTLHEESAPDGYNVAADVTFTVNKDGKEQSVTMTDVKTTTTQNKDVSGNGTSNAKTATASANGTTTGGTTSGAASTSTANKTPATGDILFPFILAGLAALGCGIGFFVYGRKEKNKRK